MFFKVDLLKILMFFKLFAIFTGKHLCWSLFFNKVEGLKPAILLKKRLQHKCLPVTFEKSYRTSPRDCFGRWLSVFQLSFNYELFVSLFQS